MNSSMPIQQNHSNKPGFPLRLFAAAFVLSLLTVAFSGWQAWQMHHRFQELSDKRAHVTEDIGRIMLFDEMLTMSARLAAATGDFSYENRYDQFDAQLTAVINHVRADLPQAEIAPHIEATDAANLALVKIELQAFALAHQGKRQEATALLTGAEYLRLKKVYADGMKKTADAMMAFIEMEQRHLHYLADLSAAANIAGILVLLAIWFFTARSARSWATERREFEGALQKSHDELGVLVKQRTADLSSTNEKLRYEIADHKLIELRLQESEEKFRKITASAVDAIITADDAGNIIGWNGAAARLFGYTEAEVNGQPLTVLMPERFRKLHSEGLARVAAGGVPHVIGNTVELVGLRKDGSEFPLELSLSQWKANYHHFFTAIIRDITEHKQTETAFRALVGTAAANVGAAFFHETVRSLSAWLGAECVIIGELEDGNRVRALAMQLDGQAIEHYEYALPGTPCNNVAHKGYCAYPEGVCQLFPSDKDLSDMGAEAYVGTPIRDNNGKAIGVLCAISRHKLVLPPMTQGVFEIIAARAGAEIKRQHMEEESLGAGIRLKEALENAIGAIAATLEQCDPYTAGHQRRVAQLAAAIGKEMGLASEAIEGIHFGGLIHDLGKISVPAEILGKPGRLSDIELGLIEVHAEAGYEIVKGIAFPWPVADMVRQHHERLDGSGYPQGLKDGQIALEARILAVADVVEAMSANRPYRPGLGMEAALEEITRTRGAQLDPAAVDACLRIVREKGFVFTK